MTVGAAGDGSPPSEGGGEAAAAPVAVERAGGEHPRELLARVGIATTDPRPVIIVSGGADELHEPELTAARSMLGPAVRAAVERSGAAVIDGGTHAGVMALLGEERAREPATMALVIGVAPAGKVEHAAAPGDGETALDPNHTHFVLADSDEWGGETPLLVAIAEELAGLMPIVMVLASGGEGALAEVQHALARGWPLFAIQGTGGLADEIGAVCAGRLEHAQLRRQLDGGDVRPVGPGDPAELATLLERELRDEQGPRDVAALTAAWGLFATYDRLAVGLRRTFERFQVSILALGVVATAIALAHEEVRAGGLRDVLHWGAVVTPIVVSVLVALANRRGAGKRWVLLRAAAEAVKSEIYRYRTRTGLYSRAALRRDDGPTDRPRRLAGRLSEIESGLLKTVASGGALAPYEGPLPPEMYGAEAADDGLCRLTAQRYIAIRVADQLRYYHRKVAALERRRACLQLVTLAAGGAGALLAAAGAEIWIGVTTAVAGGALAHLAYLQVDNTIVAYNRAAAQLAALQREHDVAATTDLERLVTGGERVLSTELSGWVQQMTDALAELQAEQAEASAKAGQQRDERSARP
jgi:hypothetical protein